MVLHGIITRTELDDSRCTNQSGRQFDKGIARIIQPIPRPITDIFFLREQDDLPVGTQDMQCFQDLYRSTSVRLHGHIIQNKRARFPRCREML